MMLEKTQQIAPVQLNNRRRKQHQSHVQTSKLLDVHTPSSPSSRPLTIQTPSSDYWDDIKSPLSSRCIHETIDLIKDGARISIGVGTSVNIIGDPWLPHDNNPYVTTDHPGLVNFIVQSLFHVGRRAWDVDVVRDLFEDRDADLI
uniref:Uncharacterized protein n=1 Tax=Cannabis sativa TaxID=3483 RepID=A0A803QJP3_CANSA